MTTRNPSRAEVERWIEGLSHAIFAAVTQAVGEYVESEPDLQRCVFVPIPETAQHGGRTGAGGLYDNVEAHVLAMLDDVEDTLLDSSCLIVSPAIRRPALRSVD